MGIVVNLKVIQQWVVSQVTEFYGWHACEPLPLEEKPCEEFLREKVKCVWDVIQDKKYFYYLNIKWNAIFFSLNYFSTQPLMRWEPNVCLRAQNMFVFPIENICEFVVKDKKNLKKCFHFLNSYLHWY